MQEGCGWIVRGRCLYSRVRRLCDIFERIFAEEGELLKLGGHVGEGARCEAAVVGESVSKVGSRGFSGFGVSGRGAGAVASATDSEPAKQGIEE
jgi:hypothetical protein